MTIKELFKLKLGESVRVANKSFTYVGHAKIELDSDRTIRWLYNDENGMLSISPEDEEIMLLQEVETDLEPDGDTITFKEKEYEFLSEESGAVVDTHGESVAEPDETFLISDYQTTDGEILRIVNNEASGENLVYEGKYVSEDDIVEL
ncbi:DUF4178 domain-containing protein [Candidatus Uhrbacteria bacterium]|nr:DUF4178 domain-containing protein [Candidatus Uhrbacteria bacterium]